MKLGDKEYENYNDFYTAVLKKYELFIKGQVCKIIHNYDDQQDVCQIIRIFLYHKLKNYKDYVPLDFFVKNNIGFAILKYLCEVKKQDRFENGFVSLDEQHFYGSEQCDYITNHEEEIIEIFRKLLPKLSMKHKIVLFTLFYNFDKKNYQQLAAMLNMKYVTFLTRLYKIKLIAEKIHKKT